MALDNAGTKDADPLTDEARAALVARLSEAGHVTEFLLSYNAIGAAFGHSGTDIPFAHVPTDFAPRLAETGLGDDVVRRILIDNPRAVGGASIRCPTAVRVASRVNTVLGPIAARRGFVAIQDHVGYGMPGPNWTLVVEGPEELE
ncbi:phosphotriesterase family protein [Saccharomonospora marina]|uniref:phosphotriesterase family protein n=1 Tax=Saccharomonospora marina TaxID=632569 RepID=UPI0003121279|nr:hypothetical protein [Saccharomonospora marina]